MYEQVIGLNDHQVSADQDSNESLVLLAEMQLALVGGGIGTVTIG